MRLRTWMTLLGTTMSTTIMVLARLCRRTMSSRTLLTMKRGQALTYDDGTLESVEVRYKVLGYKERGRGCCCGVHESDGWEQCTIVGGGIDGSGSKSGLVGPE